MVEVKQLEDSSLKSIVSNYDAKHVIIICDENTVQYVPFVQDEVGEDVQAVQIHSGEDNKNINTLAAIWQDLTRMNFRRNGLVINLGGGVITDMGGFAAATYKRGVDFIQLPTSLLAMVDAAIGGKTGIDFLDYKNQIGCIANAKAVICDVEFLDTLNPSQLKSGFAEVLKHGLVADKSYWDYVKTGYNEDTDWQKVVEGSVGIKSTIVNADPLEKAERRLLNFGHTIGHALESVYLEDLNPIMHGNAVAAGMIMEAYISREIVSLSDEDFEEIVKVIDSMYNRLEIDANYEKRMLEKMKNDKKNIDSSINFTLLSAIGKGEFNQSAGKDLIKKAIAFYRS